MKNLTTNRLNLRINNGLFALMLLVLSFQFVGGQSLTQFVENKGQWPATVDYRTDLDDRTIFLHGHQISYILPGKMPEPDVVPHDYSHDSLMVQDMHCVRVSFINANTNVQPIGYKITPTQYNFYLGDKANWADGVRSYELVKSPNLYDGIDIEAYISNHQFKYDFVVHPGADPSEIKWKYTGGNSTQLLQGNIRIQTSTGELQEIDPIAYQTINGNRVNVPCSFQNSTDYWTYHLPNGYDTTEVLVIDPTVVFSRQAGATTDNFGYTATYDRDGFLYSGVSVFGRYYDSLSFPTTPGAYQINFAGGTPQSEVPFPYATLGGTDIGLTKYDTTGSFMVYSTLIGGVTDELPHSIITDEFGLLYMLGSTSSYNYPVTENAFDTTFGGGPDVNLLHGVAAYYDQGSDIIVSKLSADGGALLSSTFVGGSSTDGLNTHGWIKYNYADEIRGEIILDDQNNVFVASSTWSTDFPTVNGFQDTLGGEQDGVVFKLSNDLGTMMWSSYLGGNRADAAYTLKLTKQQDLIVAGGSSSDSLSCIFNGYLNVRPAGRCDGFITKLKASDYTPIAGTYWGTEDAYDQIYLMDLDNSGAVHVFGQTENPVDTFIVNAAYSNPNSGQFITKFSPDLDSIRWSTLFGSGGGRPDISPSAFLVDVCNKIYLSGWGGSVNQNYTYSNNAGYTIRMPVTTDAYSPTTVDSSDFYFFVLEDDASDIVYGSYFGSPTSPEHVDGGTSRFDKKGRIYQSICAGCGQDQNFPKIPATFMDDPQYGNNSYNCNNGTVKMDFEYPQLIADFRFKTNVCSAVVEFSERSKTFDQTVYTWDFGDGTTSNERFPKHVFPEPGQYKVQLTVEDPTSCNIADSSHRMVVIADDGIVPLDTSFFCSGRSTQLGFIPEIDAIYAWEPSYGLSDTSIANPVYSGDSSLVFTVTVIKDSCTTYFQLPVEKVTPRAYYQNIFPACPQACNSGGTIIGGQGQRPYQYLWENGATTATVNNLCPGVTNYTVTDALGCSVTDSLLTVESTIDLTPPTIVTDIDSIALGETIHLFGTPNSAHHVRWIRNGEVLDQTTTLTDNPSTSGWYVFEVFDLENSSCSTRDSIYIKVLPFECGYPYIFVPNAFSPNGDGENDVLYVRGRNIESIFFAVYNRWGEQVFVTEDINFGWDGFYKGMKADPMVFDYYLRITCTGSLEPEILKGNVTLLR